MHEAIFLTADIMAAAVFLFSTNPPDRARLTGLYRRFVSPHSGASHHAR